MQKPQQQSFKIDGRPLGQNHKPYMIAELSCNHDGHFDRAINLLQAAKDAGADAAKIQSYSADCMTLDCDKPNFMISSGLWKGMTLHKLYTEAATPFEWHERLFKAAKDIGITLFSSPFSHEAIDLLENLGAPAYKIASFEIVDLELISYAASKGKPMIFSTGLSSLEDARDAYTCIKAQNNHQIGILHCISEYMPTYTMANLNNITRLHHAFPDAIIGLSDHSPGALLPTLATPMGARIVEKHLILDRDNKSHDDKFSMTPDEFKHMVSSAHEAFDALGNFDGDELIRPKEEAAYTYSRRSLYIVKDIKAGETLTKENVRAIRPGHGMKPKFLNTILGKRVNQNVDRGTAVSWDILEEGHHVATKS